MVVFFPAYRNGLSRSSRACHMPRSGEIGVGSSLIPLALIPPPCRIVDTARVIGHMQWVCLGVLLGCLPGCLLGSIGMSQFGEQQPNPPGQQPQRAMDTMRRGSQQAKDPQGTPRGARMVPKQTTYNSPSRRHCKKRTSGRHCARATQTCWRTVRTLARWEPIGPGGQANTCHKSLWRKMPSNCVK